MDTNVADRQHWMSVMAKAAAQQLLALSAPLIESERFELIRKPEVGLTQIRARMGGTGSQFNMGDMTFTRCVVESAQGIYGYSYVAGRNKAHALRAAQLDALLQDAAQREQIMTLVITPLQQQWTQQQQQAAAATATTKVNFFTLVRGED